MSQVKTCNLCGETKPATIRFWYRNPTCSDKLSGTCIQCALNRQRERRAARSPAQIESDKAKAKAERVAKATVTAERRLALKKQRHEESVERRREEQRRKRDDWTPKQWAEYNAKARARYVPKPRRPARDKNELQRIRYHANLEASRKRRREMVRARMADPIKRRQRQTARQSLRRTKLALDPLYDRRNAVKRYGIDLIQYNRMLEQQSGRCAACGSSDPHDHYGKFHIDHNHITGEVRELLCNPCNFTIGAAQENVGRLQQIQTYLSRPKPRLIDKARTAYASAKDRMRDAGLRHRIGITLGQFDELLNRQGMVCACCGSNDPQDYRGRFHADHCHTTNQVRGIICRPCNHAIGQAREDLNRLSGLVGYLRRHEREAA